MRDKQETIHAIAVAKEEVEQVKPKVRKLRKKLLLVPATEAIDEKPNVEIVGKKQIKKKPFILENSSDEED